jgi:hypothetical protein
MNRLGSWRSFGAKKLAQEYRTVTGPRIVSERQGHVLTLLLWYDGAIMMSRTQITLENEMQRRARRRASDLGVSLAEYFRRLVERDLARPEAGTDVQRIFDLGNSGGSDITRDKDAMIAEALDSSRRKRR